MGIKHEKSPKIPVIVEEFLMQNLNDPRQIVFGIIGSGWRTEFFLRIAKELPERFKVAGVVTRTEASGKKIEEKFGDSHIQNNR